MMRKQQRGITALGAILLLGVFGTIAFGVIQMVPVYMESMKIAQVLEQVKADLDGQSPTIVEIRKSLGKRVNIEDLNEIDYTKDFVIKRSAVGYEVSTTYSRKRLFVSNLYLLAEFDYAVEILQ
jgi:Domain of unknown function (DUF4845)